jgi:hypothetical protein
MASVGLSGGQVVIIQRDVETGELGDFLGAVQGLGTVTSVIWDE